MNIKPGTRLEFRDFVELREDGRITKADVQALAKKALADGKVDYFEARIIGLVSEGTLGRYQMDLPNGTRGSLQVDADAVTEAAWFLQSNPVTPYVNLDNGRFDISGPISTKGANVDDLLKGLDQAIPESLILNLRHPLPSDHVTISAMRNTRPEQFSGSDRGDLEKLIATATPADLDRLYRLVATPEFQALTVTNSTLLLAGYCFTELSIQGLSTASEAQKEALKGQHFDNALWHLQNERADQELLAQANEPRAQELQQSQRELRPSPPHPNFKHDLHVIVDAEADERNRLAKEAMKKVQEGPLFKLAEELLEELLWYRI